MKSLCSQYGLLTIAVPITGMGFDIERISYVSMVARLFLLILAAAHGFRSIRLGVVKRTPVPPVMSA
jgi:hypothetical protein